MSAFDERGTSLRLLEGLEDGRLDGGQAAILAGEIDPVLVYVIVRYLRAVYPASDPAATAVLERVVRLTRDPAVVRKHAEGARDPVSQWFESEYEYADFRRRHRELIELIVDKLET